MKSKFKMMLSTSPITTTLLIILGVVYLYTSIRYSFDMNAMQGIMAGAYVPAAIELNHEYYRFITANFIHFGLIHLLCNGLSLYNIGPFIEHSYKKGQYIFLLVTSALATTMIPYLFEIMLSHTIGDAYFTVSGGASGIVLGLLGSLCFLAFRHRGIYMQVFHSILSSLILIIIISISVPTVSLSGHVGGFIGGVVAAILIELSEIRKKSTLLN